MSNNKYFQFSLVKCFHKEIILVRLFIVLVSDISIKYLIIQFFLIILDLSFAWYRMHAMFIYTHLIISMLKNYNNTSLSFVTSYLPFMSFKSLHLVLQKLKCTLFIKNHKNNIYLRNYVNHCDLFKGEGKFKEHGNHRVNTQFIDLPTKVLKLIPTRYLCYTMISNDIIFNLQTLLSKQNYEHLKITKNKFLIRPKNGQKLPFSKKDFNLILNFLLISS